MTLGVCCITVFSVVGCAPSSVETLRAKAVLLSAEQQRLAAENDGLRARVELAKGGSTHLVLFSRERRFELKCGGTVLLEGPVAPNVCVERDREPGKEGYAAHPLPKGLLRVLSKRESPTWARNDWSLAKAARAAPAAVSGVARRVAGPLGSNAIVLTGGLILHGLPEVAMPSEEVDHLCIVLEQIPLRAVFSALDAGSTVLVL